MTLMVRVNMLFYFLAFCLLFSAYRTRARIVFSRPCIVLDAGELEWVGLIRSLTSP